MRKIIVTLGIMLATSASAQVQVFTGANGEPLATGIQAGRNTFYYGESGEPVGTAIRAGQMTWYYDANGNPLATQNNLGGVDE